MKQKTKRGRAIKPDPRYGYYVYIVSIWNLGDDMWLKVGISKNPADRIKTYRTHNPHFAGFDRVYGVDSEEVARAIEATFLSTFHMDREDDREWVCLEEWTGIFDEVIEGDAWFLGMMHRFDLSCQTEIYSNYFKEVVECGRSRLTIGSDQ